VSHLAVRQVVVRRKLVRGVGEARAGDRYCARRIRGTCFTRRGGLVGAWGRPQWRWDGGAFLDEMTRGRTMDEIEEVGKKLIWMISTEGHERGDSASLDPDHLPTIHPLYPTRFASGSARL